MPTGIKLFYPAIDGYVHRIVESTWNDAHDVTTGDGANSSAHYHSRGLRSSYTASGRGAGWYVGRCFFSFDTSDIVDTPKSRVQLKIKGYGYHAANIIHCVKATSDIESAITTADFDSIEGWVHDADNSRGNAIAYASNTTAWIVGDNLFTLNGQALADIAGQDRLNICLLTHIDLANTAEAGLPPSDTHYSGLYFSNHAAVSNRPILELTQQNNSIFMGMNF